MLPKELKYAENVLVSMFLKLSSVLPTTMQCLGSLGGGGSSVLWQIVGIFVGLYEVF